MIPVIAEDGEVTYSPGFFSREESDDLFSGLRNEVAWRHEPIILFGKQILQPRLTAWYGDEGRTYRYSGLTMEPLPWTPRLLRIKEAVEASVETRFTSALLNFYRDQSDSMGWHSDDEPELGRDPIIASVSFGATRTFRFRHRDDHRRTHAIDLAHGSLLLMRGATQHHWQHALPKRKGALGSRLNLTFRVLKTTSS